MSLGQQHTLLRTLVLAELRERIATGALPPNGRLVEDQIATELGVSRNPVREALRILEAEGLVRMSPRRGAVVVTLTADDAVKVFEVRLPLESLAARLAARKATESQVAKLRALLGVTSSAVGSADAGALGRRNTEFHREIHEIAGNSYLASVMQSIAGRMEWIFRQNALRRGPGSLHEHRAIVDAIESRHEALAADLAADHVRSAQVAFLELDHSLLDAEVEADTSVA